MVVSAGSVQPVRCLSQAAADEAARAEAERIAASHAEAEGVAFGDPALKAGVAVSVGGVGRFSGRYLLTHTRHVFDDRGYTTAFQVAGQQDRSLLGLVAGAQPKRKTAGSERKIYGLVIAIVTGNEDPEDLAGSSSSSPGWTTPTSRLGTRRPARAPDQDSGLVFLPDVDDEVLVALRAWRHPPALRPRRPLERRRQAAPGRRACSTTATTVARASSRARTTGSSSSTTTSKSGIALLSGDNSCASRSNQTGIQ